MLELAEIDPLLEFKGTFCEELWAARVVEEDVLAWDVTTGSRSLAAPDELLVGLEAIRMDGDVIFLDSLICVLGCALVCDLTFESGVVILSDSVTLTAL
jgi:hypothetical protein